MLPKYTSIPGNARPTAAQAIDFLMPQFPERDLIRKITHEIAKDNQSYFATIPMDITNIILDMLPDLRHRYSADAFDSVRQELDRFLAKYGTGEFDDHDMWILNEDLLNADFPDENWDYESTRVKFVRGCPHFQDVFTGKTYLGQNIFVLTTPDEIFVVDGDYKDVRPFPKLFREVFDPTIFHILPCGLVVLCTYVSQQESDAATDRATAIANIHTGQCVLCYDCEMIHEQLMDDSGAVTTYDNKIVSSEVWGCSEYTPNFAQFTVKKPNPDHI